MFRLRTIERPITHTLRPVASAASITCCRRWIWDANEVTMTRPRASPMIRRSGGAPVDGRHVDLEVAGVDDRAARRAQHDGDRVGDRMGHPHELDLEGAYVT